MRIRVLAYMDVLLLTASETLLTSRLFNGRDHLIRILPTALVAIVSHLQSKHQNNKRPTRFQIKSHQSNQKCLLSPKPTQATVLLPAHLSTTSQSTSVRIVPAREPSCISTQANAKRQKPQLETCDASKHISSATDKSSMATPPPRATSHSHC